ncbi:hypothetical protein [Acidihalobacter prosperus]
MQQLPPREQQIIQAHAGLIVNVVQAAQNPELRPQLEQLLRTSEENGWGALVAAVRRILEGSRDLGLLARLDEEDSVIVEAILRGLQDPTTLPDPNARPDPVLAAPGLAGMIHACTRGDVQALELLSQMAEQMTNVGGDMGRMGGLMRRLVEGERDPEVLLKGMGAQGESLVLAVLEELGKLEAH